MARRATVDRSGCPGIVQSGKNKGKPKKGYRWGKRGARCPVRVSGARRAKAFKHCASVARKAYEAGYAKGRKGDTASTPMLNGAGLGRVRRRRRGRH